MIVIVEGARAVGKTYLVDQLVARWPDRSSVVKQPRGEDPTTDLLSAWSSQMSPNELYIWDRAHLTEYVMSTLRKRRSESSLHVDTVILSSWLKREGTLTIVLFADPRLIRKRLKGRPEKDRKLDVRDLNVALSLWNQAARTFLPMGGQGMILKPQATKESTDRAMRAAIEAVEEMTGW